MLSPENSTDLAVTRLVMAHIVAAVVGLQLEHGGRARKRHVRTERPLVVAPTWKCSMTLDVEDGARNRRTPVVRQDRPCRPEEEVDWYRRLRRHCRLR